MPIQSHVEDKAFRSFCAINRAAVKKSLGDNSSNDKVNAQLKELWKVFSKSVHEEDIIDMKNFKDNINSRFTDDHPLEKIFTSFDKKLDEFYLIHSKENAPAKLYELRETLTDEFYPLKEKFLTLCTDLENEDYMTDYTEDVLGEMESDIENMFCRFDNDIEDILEKLGDDEKVDKKIQDMSSYIKESFILFDNKLEQLRFDYLV
jgi:hypothetical protein